MENEMTFYCPTCGGKTKFSPETERWVCEYCGNEHVFHLPRRFNYSDVRQDLQEKTNTNAVASSTRNRKLLPQPQDVKFTKRGDSLTFSWRWFSLQYIFLAFFCVAWDAFLCFWYGMALGSRGTPWIMIVFPIFHVAVGIGLTYYTLAGFLNHTTVRVDRRSFSVQHSPLPWFGAVNIPIQDLKQLYTQEKSSRESNRPATYQLNAVLNNGRKLKLASNLNDPDISFFLEQQIEHWLNIEDEPVYGEMRV